MKISEIKWRVEEFKNLYETLYTYEFEDGRFTVLDRMTGFGWRDIETGYKDKGNLFWLASGNFDIRMFEEVELKEAVEIIKRNANIRQGV